MRRREFIGLDVLARPAASERAPRLLVHVLQAPRGQGLFRIARSLAKIRRIGQSRPVHVGQVAQDFHDVRALEAFTLENANRRGVRARPAASRSLFPCVHPHVSSLSALPPRAPEAPPAPVWYPEVARMHL